MIGTFGGALEARQIDASGGRLTADVTGEVEKPKETPLPSAEAPALWHQPSMRSLALRGLHDADTAAAKSTMRTTARLESTPFVSA